MWGLFFLIKYKRPHKFCFSFYLIVISYNNFLVEISLLGKKIKLCWWFYRILVNPVYLLLLSYINLLIVNDSSNFQKDQLKKNNKHFTLVTAFDSLHVHFEETCSKRWRSLRYITGLFFTFVFQCYTHIVFPYIL